MPFSLRGRTVVILGLAVASVLVWTGISVAVTPAKGKPPKDLVLSKARIAENLPPGTIVARLSAIDRRRKSKFTFTLVRGKGSSDNARFRVRGNRLLTAVTFDYETRPRLSIRLRVRNRSTGRSRTEIFRIRVTNVSEAPSDIALSPSAVAENEPVNRVVGAVSATDSDAGDAHTFSLVAGTGDADNGSFDIAGGTLRASAVFDFESKSSHSIRVRATDRGGLRFEKQLTVTVTNANDAPTDTALSNATVAEDQISGTLVGLLSASDQDVLDPLSFSLVGGAGDADNGSFQISGTMLQTTGPLDFETKSSYTIRVRVSDGNGGAFEEQLVIAITNVNEAPSDVALSPSSVAEGQPAGTTVGALSASDEDAGATHGFALVPGAGATDNGSFQISGSTLQTAAMLSIAGGETRSIRVRATDNGALTFEKVLTITITNVVGSPTNIALSPSSVAENQVVNTVVGTLSAADPDVGDTHTFSLVAGSGDTDNASFNILGGSLRTSAMFNFETKSSYSIRVRATDGAGLTFDKVLTVTITNVNEAPVATNDSYTGAIGNTKATRGITASGEPVVTLSGNTLIANDSDPDGSALSTVAETVSTSGGGSATIDSAGQFSYMPGVGDKNQTDSFTYKVTDGTLQSTGTVQITIANERVWYVDRDAASNGDGRSTSPLQNLAGINGAGGSGDADGTSDVIFLFSSATAYTGGLPLESGQQLIGEPQGLTVNGVTVLPAGGSNPVIQNAGGNAITLANGVVTRRVNVGTTSGDGITGTSIATADIGGSSAVSGVSGADFKLSGGSGSITFGAAITNTAGRSVDIQNRTGGTVTLNGAITDNGTGVFLNANTGATVAFNGDVDVSSGTNPAFTATGGGTVTAVGAGKTLATTTGIALNVSATSIGTGGINFQSIAANGATSGIVLADTGTTGGLTVAGTGSVPSGGTIQNTTGPGVSLTNTDAVSLNNMAVTGANQSGIQGTGVTGFSYTNGSITNAGDSKADKCHAAFAFNKTAACFGGTTHNNIDGAVTITGNTITNPYGGGIDIHNYAGTISDAVITGNTFTSATSAADSQEDGISLYLLGTTTTVASLTKATIQNNSINNFPGGGAIVINGGNSSGDGVGEAAPPGTYGVPNSANVITITGNSIVGDPVTKFNGAGISTGVAGRGQGNFSITSNGTAGNPLRNVAGVGIGVGAAGNVTAHFVVTGNFMAPNNEFNSSGIGVGMDTNIQADGSEPANPLINATVSDNAISNTEGAGVRVLSSNSNGTLNLKLQNNTISSPIQSFAGISVENGSSADPAWNPTMCAMISGNTANSGPPDGFGDKPPGINLTKRSALSNTYVFGITGLSPSPATVAQTESYVTTQNPSSALGAGFWAGKRVGVVSGSNFTSCTLPF